MGFLRGLAKEIPSGACDFGNLNSAQLGKRWQHIQVRSKMLEVASTGETSFGPMNEKRHAMTALVDGGFFSPHAGIVSSHRFGIEALEFASG